MKKIFLLLVPLLSFLGTDCKNDPISPDDIKPGRRDYVWTVDTLQLPFGDIFTPTRIWGSSPNDVWITGTGDAGDLLWHYDGIKWTRDSARYLISPSALWGTASNNIWMGNSNSTFWHYDGMKWYKFSEHSFGDYRRILIENIYGISSNNVYGVGGADQSATGEVYRGIIMHYDGTSWKFILVPPVKVGFSRIFMQRSTGLFLLEGTRYESTGDTSKIYTFDGSVLKEIYSGINYASLAEIDGEIVIVYDKKIHKYSNGKLTVWKDLSNTEFLGAVFARTEKDFFAYTKNSSLRYGIGHFNGTDFQTIFTIPEDFRISGGMIFDEEIFFQCFSLTSNCSIVIHGKLQK